jgi:hypothetical protein
MEFANVKTLGKMRSIAVVIMVLFVASGCHENNNAVKTTSKNDTLAITGKNDTVSYSNSLEEKIKEEAKPVYVAAMQKIIMLRSYIKLADSGDLKKSDVINQYNEMVADRMGRLSNYNKVKKRINEDGDAYAEMLYNIECANIAARKAAEAKANQGN